MSRTTLSKKLLKGIAVISFFGSIAFAQALTISPARVELSGDPSSSVTDEFLLINEQNTDQTFYTSVENFVAQGESGAPSFSTSKEGVASWISVTDKIVLKKGERAKVPFTITIPKDADAGGHFAAIFLSTVPASTKAGEVAVGAKVGMLVLLRVSGDIKEGGGLLSFGLKEGNHFATSLPVDFVYRFNNSGNDRANPTGILSVRNIIGYETESLNANPTVGNVLPSSTRRFEVLWGTEAPLPESASFLNHVRYEARNFAFGPYFANLSLTYGASGAAHRSVVLFIFPWHLLIVIAFILGIIFLIGKSLVKRYNSYIISQARLGIKE